MANAENHQHTRTDPAEAAYQRALHAELDRRVADLAAAPDETFGRIGLGDGVVVVTLFVLVPALAIWICR